jgi:hypothetical protein
MRQKSIYISAFWTTFESEMYEKRQNKPNFVKLYLTEKLKSRVTLTVIKTTVVARILNRRE